MKDSWSFTVWLNYVGQSFFFFLLNSILLTSRSWALQSLCTFWETFFIVCCKREKHTGSHVPHGLHIKSAPVVEKEKGTCESISSLHACSISCCCLTHGEEHARKQNCCSGKYSGYISTKMQILIHAFYTLHFNTVNKNLTGDCMFIDTSDRKSRRLEVR